MKKLLFALLAICFVGNLYAQSGTVKYWSINKNIDYKKEFSLAFNKHESFLVFDVKPYEYLSSQGYTVSSSGQYSAVYLNTQSKQGIVYKKKNKDQLIQSNIELYDRKWTIHKDFKHLLGYKVQRATLSYNYSPKGEEPAGMGEIEVWFAPKIPVNAGPNVFDGNLDFVQWGLPGLILEVSYDAAWSVQAYEVNLSKKPVKLDIPEEAIPMHIEQFWLR